MSFGFLHQFFRMFHLNSSLHCGSVLWDTNYARTYLQISEDQLEKINKIPGWSKTGISEKITTENENPLENIEKQLSQKASTSTENLSATKTTISAKDDVLKTQNYKSDLQLKEKLITPLTEKEIFLKTVSLSPIRKKVTSTYSLQRSSSLPDLYEEISPRKSAEIYKKNTLSTEKNLLNETYAVPVAHNDSINHDKLKINSHKSFSCLLEHPNQLSKPKKLKTLDDSILNHKYLKGIEKGVPFSSKETVKITFQPEMSLLGKKLLLLEKRLSPAKEMNPLAANAKLHNVNYEKNLISSQTFIPTNEVVPAVLSSDSVETLGVIQSTSLSKSHKSLESQSNSQLLNEKWDDSLKNTIESVKDSVSNGPKTTVCNLENFLSPPVPCGQLIATEIPSLSQPVSLQNPAKLNTPNKLQIANSPIANEQPLPTEVLPLSQPVPSQKLTKLNTPKESQNAEFSYKIVVPEKPIDTCSAFSANSNEKVPDLASTKELATKRKRKSRNEKSSKKLDVKKLKRTDIQFSSAQIRSMIEIMKIFHTEF